MKRICIRDCYDTTTGFYYEHGGRYELEDGDVIADSGHFISIGEKVPIVADVARLDPMLNRKTTKYLTKKYPEAAKKVDLRKKSAHRDLVFEIMKQQGTVESVEDEGKTQGEHLIEEKESKLAASLKR
jgi:hypothetical protein